MSCSAVVKIEIMSDLNTLKIKAHLTRYSNFVNQFKNQINQSKNITNQIKIQADIRKSKMEPWLDEFELIQSEIESLDADDSDDAQT